MNYQLTTPQRNVYITERFFGSTAISHVGGYLLLPQKEEPTTVQKAISRVLAANDGLRVRIVEAGQEVCQTITPPDEAAEAVICTAVETEDELRAYVTEQMRRPFEAGGKLYDLRVIELPRGTAVMIKLHHYIADSHTVSGLIDRLLSCLQDLNADLPSPSYVDFIRNDAAYAISPKYARDRDYWSRKYEVEPTYVSLCMSDTDPYDVRAGRSSHVLSREMTQAIRQYCEKHDISPAVFFEAVVSLYAMRLRNADDITLCTISANRNGAKERNTLGMFNTILPMTARADWKESFLSFCATIADEHYSLLRHSRYPLSDILDTVRERHGKDKALYDIMVSYQADLIKTGGAHTVEWIFNGSCELGFMMNIDDRTGNGEYHINIDYQLKKFSRNDIDKIWARLVNIIHQVLADGGILFKDVEIITATEKNKLLYEYNPVDIAYPKDICVHQIFERQAQKYPHNIAVVCGDKRITYYELNNRANQFAVELKHCGVGRETIVAVALEKSIDTIVATLGILKAGGAYLPIDPTFPLDRIEFMLSDSKAGYLVSTDAFFAKIKFDGTKLEILENGAGEYENLPCVNTQDDLLYIIYTSGSTGIPKGALIEHKNVVRLFFNDHALYDFSEHDVWTMFHSYCFDFSVWEMYGALLYGGKLIIVPKETARDTNVFLDLVKRERVTVLNQTPAAFYNFAEYEARGAKSGLSLRYVIFGGEALKPTLLQQFHTRHPQVALINMYGITETTVHVTYKELSQADLLLENSNIGKPIPTLMTYIMDKEQGLLPFGIPGEICVGGAGVCRGYLNRPELTAQKFVMDPKLGVRLYRSGDSAVLHEDGNMEYRGRIDNQVKIRGFRVELGEIEKKILSYKRVKNVVVSVYRYNGDDLLCAYIVPEAHIDISLLKGYLHTLLPDYMIPGCFMELDTLPLTSNGKVDRRALPQPTLTHENIDYIAPQNEIEAKFEKIFCDLLRVEKISVEADLFDYGASSFTVVKFLTEIYSENYQITTADVYRYKTIRKLSALIYDRKNVTLNAAHELEIETVPTYNDTDSVSHKAYGTILLTGATGFLGSHILYELITGTDSNMVCVVRGKDKFAAEKRLYETLAHYFGNAFVSQSSNRIDVVCGNISEKDLGMDASIIPALRDRVDLIIHAAALVKYYGDEEEFKRMNVEGTRNAIGLAKQLGARYAHISTVGISGSYLTRSEVKGAVIDEKMLYVGQNYTDNLYVKTKFEAENLVIREMNHGMDATIFRMGNLIGRWSDGHFQVNINENAFYNILRSVIGLGRISDSMLNVDVELTPVDLAAGAVVQIVTTNESNKRIFHIANPHELKFSVLVAYLSEMGLHIDSMRDTDFYDMLRSMTQDEEKSKLANGIMIDMDDTKKIDYNIDVTVDTKITQAFLKMRGFEWSIPTYEYLCKIIRYINEQKLL